MLAYLEVHVGWREILRRTIRDTMEDDALGLAAQLSYYFFLSLFPALLCLIALASFFPLQNLIDEATTLLQPFAPAQVIEIIRQQMAAIANSDDSALIGFGLIGALWSSSAAMGAVVNAMNRAYDIEESRPWWRVRVIAILLTIGLAVFILIALTLVLAGPQLADAATRWFGMPAVWAMVWKLLQWPLVFLLVSTAVGLIYYFAPDAEQEWAWITPGSLLAATLWLAGTLGFRLYVVNFGNYDATYGTLGGIIVLLLWFYLTGLVIVIGAEMNAEIEHASPWGKEKGEKVPGQKKKIGYAAARAHRERRST